jgi:hypothetical protein
VNRVWRAVASSCLLAACISTDLDEHELRTCASRAASAPDLRALVRLTLRVPPNEECNAVVIAPTLLLTTVNCISTLVSRDEDRGGSTPPRCMPSGAPIEDGSFLFRYAMPVEAGSVRVASANADAFDAMIDELFVSAAASTCTADLALVKLQLAIGAPVLPVRLDAQELAGDQVVIAGDEIGLLGTELLTSTASILESTSDQGSPTLPPRSLLLSGDTCAKAGSAVLSADTGALIGLLQPTARTINCEDGADASPIAVRVAPFRRFLLEGAAAAQTSLLAEYGSDASGLIPLCEDL